MKQEHRQDLSLPLELTSIIRGRRVLRLRGAARRVSVDPARLERVLPYRRRGFSRSPVMESDRSAPERMGPNTGNAAREQIANTPENKVMAPPWMLAGLTQ